MIESEKLMNDNRDFPIDSCCRYKPEEKFIQIIKMDQIF